MTRFNRSVKVLISAALLGAGLILIPSPPANAAPVIDAAPVQAQCESGGSTNHLWGDGALTGVNRPVVASMTVNGETVPFGEIAAPNDHKLGIAICPNMADARKVGLTVVHREGMNYTSDLIGALTPLGSTVTANTAISFTLTNMGTLAEHYSFSLVHGKVSNWTTNNLGTASASLSVTMKPARTPLVDYSAPGAQFCSATPPVCNAASSGLDIMSASLDMDFDQAGNFEDFTGSYFALEGAVAGFVTPEQNNDGSRSIVATLGGPHTLADGTTANVGSMQAYLPNAVLTDVLGVDPAGISTSDLAVARIDPTDPGAATFGVTSAAGGAVVEVTNITFSTPEYTISSAEAAEAAAPEENDSYRMFGADGGVYNFGNNEFHGSAGALKLAKPVVGGVSTSNSKGYWMVAADGGLFNYGNAHFHGSAANVSKFPAVGIASTPNDGGYWIVANDGGVFSYGTAAFHGSTGAMKLNAPIVGIASTPSGNGYWLVASDGGTFAYGDAKFFGSMGGTKLNSPVVGIAASPTGNGYWMVAQDGGVFGFGDAKFHGSMGGTKMDSPIVGISATADGKGYELASSVGGVYNFGTSKFAGSVAGQRIAKPIVGIG